MNILLCVDKCAHAYFICSKFKYFDQMEFAWLNIILSGNKVYMLISSPQRGEKFFALRE